jgi:RimJ/RimL family protein N-acetyltransferase
MSTAQGAGLFLRIVAGVGMDLDLRLLTRAEAERVVLRRRDPARDRPWARGYPLEGDTRACASYAGHLPASAGPGGSNPFGYYQIVEEDVVVGGIGFHGPPDGGMVEVGYGVVPGVRGRGVATAALRMLLSQVIAAGDGAGRVTRVVGRTEETNVASQKVMLAVGMQLVGRDPDFLHFEMDVRGA